MSEVYYLSDRSYAWFRREANLANITVGQYVERCYPEWVARTPVIADASVAELVKARASRMELQTATVVERGDRPAPKYQAPPLYDGVVWQAVFGAWRRRPHGISGISEDCALALADWIEQSEVVRRRAATTTTLVSQALELIGRGWIK